MPAKKKEKKSTKQKTKQSIAYYFYLRIVILLLLRIDWVRGTIIECDKVIQLVAMAMINTVCS